MLPPISRECHRIGHNLGVCYLFLPNRSCHFPLAPPRLLVAPPEVPAVLSGTTSSSTVSRMVDTIEIPCSGFSGVEGVGERSMKALEVFF